MFARRNAPRRRNKQLGFVATGLGGAGPNFGSGGRFNVQQWLFGSGEQGGWWDPSDLTTMFQDSAGTTPVTAVGQPVGLMLDKRLGAALGSNVRSTAAIGVVGVATAATYNTGTGAATTARVDVSNRSFVRVSGLVTGGTYLVSVTNTGASSVVIRSAGTSYAVVAAAASTTIRVPSVDGTFQFDGSTDGTSQSFTIDAVQSLAGNHRTQATAASRPTLRQDASGYYYLEYDGVDDSMATGSVDFSGTDKMTVWAGVNKQSDAAAGIFVELTSGIGANNGAFTLAAPNGAAANNFSWASKGTAQASCVTGAFYASPSAVVIAAEADIANDICRQRVSGTAITNSGVDQGTGSFSNAALYFGRRGGSSLPFNGREYQTIIRGAATDTILLANAERFIGSKMGIAL